MPNPQSNPRPEFSLIVPTIDEAENLQPLLAHIVPYLVSVPHEIIIVDDSQNDGTRQESGRLHSTYPQLKYIKGPGKGLSAAITMGFSRAEGRILGVMDADLSHDASILPALLQAITQGASIAVGSRRVKNGGADHWPWFRRLYSNVATWFARRWLNLPVADPMSGYFVLKRETFELVQETLDPKGYKILVEIVARTREESIVEVPFIFRNRKQGHSKLSTRVAIQYLSMLWDLRTYSVPMHGLRKAYHTGRYRKVCQDLIPGKTLDIGCGRPCETMKDQAFLRFLNRPDAVGLDIKPVTGPFEFHQGDIAHLPFPDAHFDNVVAMEVLEHITEIDAALSEVRRVLKPGGVFVMSTPDCHWAWEMIWDAWTHFIGHMWHDAHVTEMRADEWAKKLGEYFTVTSTKRHWLFDFIVSGRKKP